MDPPDDDDDDDDNNDNDDNDDNNVNDDNDGNNDNDNNDDYGDNDDELLAQTVGSPRPQDFPPQTTFPGPILLQNYISDFFISSCNI